MARSRSAVVLAAALVAAPLSGCIAGTVPERVGGIAVSVDDQGRPVVVVHPCEPSPLAVSMVLGRQGLGSDQTNEAVGVWTAPEPVAGTTELLLHDPGAPWDGGPVEVLGGRTYVVDASAGGQTSLGTVTFGHADLTAMQRGSVYVNGTDPDDAELVQLTVEEFVARACAGS